MMVRMFGDGEEGPPFRWDLVTPDQLGTLLADGGEPDLWFLEELIACAGKVLARSGNGDLVFVGRSLDSMFDLLGGASADLQREARLWRLALAFPRDGGGTFRPRRPRAFTPGEPGQA